MSTTAKIQAGIITSIVGIALMVAFAAPAMAASGPDSPTADQNNPASCLGAERATENSNGGDRDHGDFGPEQADFVQSEQPYGQWLQGWMSDCDNAPGQ